MNTSVQWRAEDYSGHGGLSSLPSKHAVIGLRVFLAVVTSLFFLLIIAWLMRSQFNDWQALSQPWQPLARPWQLSLNTGLLITASACLQRARHVESTAKNWVFLGGFFTLLFLAGQLWLWRQLNITGFGVAGNPANSFFYLLTGLHGLHLVGGLVAWCRLMLSWSSITSRERLRLRIQLCTTYWHYLLFIWLVLFGLLISPPASIEFIASLCGLTPTP